MEVAVPVAAAVAGVTAAMTGAKVYRRRDRKERHLEDLLKAVRKDQPRAAEVLKEASKQDESDDVLVQTIRRDRESALAAVPAPKIRPMHPKAGKDRDWSDEAAFSKAVEENKKRHFGSGVSDRVVFEVSKDAFAGFAQKFGHYLFSTEESSADTKVLALTMNPDAQGPVQETVGTNFGAIAQRYMYLRKQVDAPVAPHNVDGLSPNSRRYRLWKDGWQKGDGHKDMTLVERVERNPMIPFTDNWKIYLRLSVQYSMMEMLYHVFWKISQDMMLTPGTPWNDPDSKNVKDAIQEHLDSVAASAQQSKQRKYEEIAIDAVVVLAGLLSKFFDLVPLVVLGLSPIVVKRIVRVQKENGSVKIDASLMRQLNTEWENTAKKSKRDGMPPTMRFIFDDLAAFASALEVFSDKGLPPPLIGGGLKSPSRIQTAPGAARIRR
jgi:hypothetical protein